MQPGRLKIVNKWRHRLSYICSTVDFRQASLQTTEVWKASRDKTRSETFVRCYLSFYFSLDEEFLVEVWALSQPRLPPMAIQARLSWQLSILWTIILSLKIQPIILALQQQPSVTLYPNSVVVNLHDGNTSSLYNSQTLWLVQFYSHWSVRIWRTKKCHNLNVHLKVWSLPEICPLLAGPCRGHQR